MLAIEIDTEIAPDRAIHVQLPQGIPATRAGIPATRARVLCESDDMSRSDPEGQQGYLDDFLAGLLRNTLGRDREEIAALVEAERASWD